MSYLKSLLQQARALEPHEVSDLRNWLGALRHDCSVFGPTAEDEALIRQIKKRIALEESPAALSPDPNKGG